MNVCWYQDGVHLRPENEVERRLLVRMFGLNSKPSGAVALGSSGSSESGCDDLLDAVVRNDQVIPRSVAIQRCDKQSVVGIDVGRNSV
jgi:hypothetical protein